MPRRPGMLWLAALLLSPSGAAAAPDAPRIAIIIDDLGYQLDSGRRAAALPGPVVCAVLPETPRGALIAEAAFANGKEVLLHLPLQSMHSGGPREPGGILLDMDRSEIASTFARSMASVPHVMGINTHQGSLLTQHPGHMQWLMQEISAQEHLIFVDSYTTHRSIALELAREVGVPAARRDVFLDPDRAPETVEREFARLKKLARSRGAAIGIGHPYPATLEFLETALPKLAREGFELVGIRALIDGSPIVGDGIAGGTAPASVGGGSLHADTD